MSSRYLVVVLSTLLVFVLGVPASAAGPNENGKGYRVVSQVEYTSVVWWHYPVCVGDQLVNWAGPVQASWTLSDTIYEKADGTGEKWVLEGFIVFGEYRQDHWERRVTANIDPSTGQQSALNYIGKVRWSDSDGVYATQDMAVHLAWNAHGELMSDRTTDTGLVCDRTTVVNP